MWYTQTLIEIVKNLLLRIKTVPDDLSTSVHPTYLALKHFFCSKYGFSLNDVLPVNMNCNNNLHELRMIYVD